MKYLFQIKVECYSGYKANEYPKCFYWNEARIEIKEILDRWYQGNRNPEIPAANYYKVRGSDNRLYIIKHEIENDQWYIVTQDENITL